MWLAKLKRPYGRLGIIVRLICELSNYTFGSPTLLDCDAYRIHHKKPRPTAAVFYSSHNYPIVFRTKYLLEM